MTWLRNILSCLGFDLTTLARSSSGFSPLCKVASWPGGVRSAMRSRSSSPLNSRLWTWSKRNFPLSCPSARRCLTWVLHGLTATLGLFCPKLLPTALRTESSTAAALQKQVTSMNQLAWFATSVSRLTRRRAMLQNSLWLSPTSHQRPMVRLLPNSP